LVLVLTVLLGIGIFLDAVSAASDWMELQLLNSAAAGGNINPAEAEANDTRQAIIALGQLGLYVATIVAFCMWVYRANSNARALGAAGMQFTPGWSVGWYFVPIMNLFRPFQAMREIWQASDPDATSNATAWQSTGSSPVLGIWWALWLIVGFLGQVSFRMGMRDDLNSLIVCSTTGFLSNLASVPLAVCALLVIRGIHARQEQKCRNLSSASMGFPH
jgi:hypothetical protein